MSSLTESRGCEILVLSGAELQGCVRYKSKLSDDRGFRTAGDFEELYHRNNTRLQLHNLATEYAYPKVYSSKLSEYFLQ